MSTEPPQTCCSRIDSRRSVSRHLVLGPVVFAFGVLGGQSQAWLSEISIMDKAGFAAPSWLGAIPIVGMRLADTWNDALGAPGGLSALLSRVENDSLLHSLQSVSHLIVYRAFVVSVTIVEFRYDQRHFRLRVRDDGKSIDVTFLTTEGRTGHFGLHGIRERAKLMGGKLTVWSAAESGMEIELIIPATHAYAVPPRRSWFG
jgi:histidine kinase/DNA gyrase B/HSP90-like ATPase